MSSKALKNKVKLNDWVSVKDFGAVGDGVTDDTAAFMAAVSTGKLGHLPVGLYRITAPLTGGGATHIQLEGETPCHMPDQGIDNLISDTNSSSYTDLPPASLYENFTVILCDGCNLIGTPDSASIGASNALRSLKNVVLWGKNGAKIGVYTTGTNCQIDNISTVLFERAGIVNRGQILSQISNISSFDCGWNVAGSGTSGYPNTYTSGCSVLILANKIANDYTTVTPANRPTTLDVRNIWSYVRNHTETTKSGLRGVHAHGLTQSILSNLGGYTGNFFNICSGSLEAPYVENYATSGYTAGDATPICEAFVNCIMSIEPGYLANLGGSTPTVAVIDNAVPTINASVTQLVNGVYVPVNRPSAPQLTKQITVGTSGTTQSYTFPNFIRNTAGFVGFLSVSLIKTVDYTNWSRALLYVANHRAGGTAWQIGTSTSIAASNSAGVTGIYAATIGATWSGADLIVTVTWGASWGPTTAWQLDIAAFGAGTLST